jgi:D-amino-acid dehydrogenase
VTAPSAPDRAGRRSYDVAIVGGGVVGVACALELARRGAAVAVLERDRIGHGCSYGNAGWLTPSLALPLPAPGLVGKATKWLLDPDSPFYIAPRLDPGLALWLLRFLAATGRARFERGTAALVALARSSVSWWERFAATSPEPFGFEKLGLVAIYEHEEEIAAARAHAERMARLGIPSERWSAEELRAREPAVVGPQVGAWYFPDDAQCEPYAAVVALAGEARRAGADLVEDAEVFGVERAGDRIAALASTAGRFAAGEVVVATGAWSKRFGRLVRLRLPVLGAKGYTLLVPRGAAHPRRSLMLAERKLALNPHRDTLRISGTLELVDEDLSITARRVRAIVAAARGMVALSDPLPPHALWRGLRPCTPDGLPLVGRARRGRGRFANLWLATGHQMTGLKTAPATGLLLAQLLAGEPPSFDPAPFRADRYG